MVTIISPHFNILKTNRLKQWLSTMIELCNSCSYTFAHAAFLPHNDNNELLKNECLSQWWDVHFCTLLFIQDVASQLPCSPKNSLISLRIDVYGTIQFFNRDKPYMVKSRTLELRWNPARRSSVLHPETFLFNKSRGSVLWCYMTSGQCTRTQGHFN